MQLRLTILCENTVGRPCAAVGEHGFSCFIETPHGSWLFDTGQGSGILRNSQVLDRDLGRLEGIVLSHGHYDHVGGLPDVLGTSGPADVYLHPEAFRERHWVGDHERRYVGIPFRRPLLETLGARFRFFTQFTELAPGLYLSGEVPRVTDFEHGDPHLMACDENRELVPDPFQDDFSLAIDSPKGLIVVAGCAHAGLVNILKHFAQRTGRDRIYAVIGGTHLAPADDQQFRSTVAALRELGVEKIGVSHCTGQGRAAQLQAEFGSRFFFASVGATLEV